MDLRDYVASIPDFPQEGIMFRDITPLMADGDAFRYTIRQLSDYARSVKADVIVGPDARGFLFGCPVAYDLGIGFVPIRKPGKLPRKTISVSYDLEYGKNELFIHEDAIKPGQKVVVIDDLLATGGTTDASIKLVEKLGGEVMGCAFIIELLDLKGREKIQGYEVFSLMQY